MPETASRSAATTPRHAHGHEPSKVRAGRQRFSINAALDTFFFVFAGVASVWLAMLIFNESFDWGWWGLGFAVIF